MRAALMDRYGAPEVLRVVELPRPTPGSGQLLVRLVAAGVSSGDARIRAARFPKGFGPFARLAFGVRRPRRRVLGGTFSGVVAEVGPGVEGVRVGEPVCGMTGARLGTHAEYVAVPTTSLTPKPASVSHEDAAGVLFGGTTALYFLRDRARLRAGESVLVVGGSGAVGTNAVQLARWLGGRVTAVTGPDNLDLVRNLGAERVVDHTTTELTELTGPVAGTGPVTAAGSFDVVLDTVGVLSPASGRRLLAEGGRLVLAVADLAQTLAARGNVIAGSAPERVEDFRVLLDLVAAGTLRVVHDRVFTLDQIVEAHRRVDTGHKVGNVIVRFG